MRYSYKRLQELSGTEKSPEELARLLTFHAFEVESVEPLAHELDSVVVGRVETVDPHPDADRLRVTTVVTEEGSEVRTIVCGAPNVEAGQKVAVALPGAVLPNGMEIGEAKIRGVASSGMICAEDELGLGTMHEGILVLPEDAPLSTPLSEYLGLDDSILDIDILPNRGCDALSLRGVAREISALEGRSLPEADDALPGSEECSIGISVETDRCFRYIGALIERAPSETPLPIRSLLVRSGMGAHDFSVDVTNAMLLEHGQPMHAFDADRIKGSIVVRQAEDGEEIELLGGERKILSAEDIVIADEGGPVALAGVMGGARTAVSGETNRILLEVASFDPVSIRKTSKRHGIRSDSSYRFERFVDPERAVPAALDALRYFREGGAILSGLTDRFPNPTSPRTFSFSTAVFSELLGMEIDLDVARRRLAGLGLGVDGNDAEWTVSVPSFRPDLSDEWDIAEEIGRMEGYDQVPSIAPVVELSTPESNSDKRFERELKTFLAASGYDEIMTYPFYSDSVSGLFGGSWSERQLRLENPMNPNQTVFRASLIPSLIEKVRGNLRHSDHFRLFEIARVAMRGKSGDPEERKVLGIAVVAEKGEDAFPLLRGALDRIAAFSGVDLVFESETKVDGPVALLHPTRSARITVDSGDDIGIAGEISPRIAKIYSITRSIAVAEFSMDILSRSFDTTPSFRELPKYPYALRDLSLSVSSDCPAGILTQTLRDSTPLLKTVDLFDIFEKGEWKNMAFHLSFGSDERTVSGEEVDQAIEMILSAVSDRFDASISE